MVKGAIKNVEFMEFLTFKQLTETAPNTFIQDEQPTPVGRANNLAMLIHKVEFQHVTNIENLDDDRIDMQITSTSKAAAVNLDDSELIAKRATSVILNASGASNIEMIKEINFDPPILYAKSKIYFGFTGVNLANAMTGCARIAYTIRQVSQAQMIEALVE